MLNHVDNVRLTYSGLQYEVSFPSYPDSTLHLGNCMMLLYKNFVLFNQAFNCYVTVKCIALF